jgi:hypothetical protein
MLLDEKEAIDKTVRERAAAAAEQYAAKWTRPAIDRRGTEESFAPVEARYVRLVVEGQELNPQAQNGYNIEELEVWTAEDHPQNVALSAAGATAHGAERVAQDFAGAYSASLAIDGKFGARWIAAGPELTISLARPHFIRRVFFCSDKSGEAGANPVANFVSEYRVHVSLDGKEWTEVGSSHDRQPVSDAHRQWRLRELTIEQHERDALANLAERIAKVDALVAAVPKPPEWWIGSLREAPGPYFVFRGGDPQRLGDEIFPASLSSLAEVVPGYELRGESAESERRRALAEWLVHPDNPLTPRVLANRLWHYHFGRGIVDTPSDFGAGGGQPTHAELLDWLSRQVHEHQWRLKPLHRLIMTSQAYRQSGDCREAAGQIDGDARYLWRFPPRRLSAEEIRDTLLSISGQLDTRMGGPGFRLYRYLEDNVATYVPLDNFGPETYRRSVYHQNARAASVDLLTDFDSPDCSRSAPRRDATTSPIQALTMQNHQFTLDMAGHWANRVRREAGDDMGKQMLLAFELAYSRPPNGEELIESLEFIKNHGLAAFCRVLMNSNELIYLD